MTDPWRPRVLTIALLILTIVVLDQWTKELARTRLADHAHEYAGGLVTLGFTENEGAFLSLGATLPPAIRLFVFTFAVLVAVSVALFVLFTGRVHGIDAYAVTLVAAGGVGNLIDRIRRSGRVTDFIYLSAGPVHSGVFNVADVAITTGVLWLLVSSFIPHPTTPPPSE